MRPTPCYFPAPFPCTVSAPRADCAFFPALRTFCVPVRGFFIVRSILSAAHSSPWEDTRSAAAGFPSDNLTVQLPQHQLDALPRHILHGQIDHAQARDRKRIGFLRAVAYSDQPGRFSPIYPASQSPQRTVRNGRGTAEHCVRQLLLPLMPQPMRNRLVTASYAVFTIPVGQERQPVVLPFQPEPMHPVFHPSKTGLLVRTAAVLHP